MRDEHAYSAKNTAYLFTVSFSRDMAGDVQVVPELVSYFADTFPVFIYVNL